MNIPPTRHKKYTLILKTYPAEWSSKCIYHQQPDYGPDAIRYKPAHQYDSRQSLGPVLAPQPRIRGRKNQSKEPGETVTCAFSGK